MKNNKSVAWGEIINAVRTLHLRFYQKFPFPHVNLELQQRFHFPPSLGSIGHYEELPIPEELAEIIELHPVERALIEGPLFVSEEISIQSEVEINFIFKQILMLEREWLAHMFPHLNATAGATLEQIQFFLEQQFLQQWNHLQPKTSLKAVK